MGGDVGRLFSWIGGVRCGWGSGDGRCPVLLPTPSRRVRASGADIAAGSPPPRPSCLAAHARQRHPRSLLAVAAAAAAADAADARAAAACCVQHVERGLDVPAIAPPTMQPQVLAPGAPTAPAATDGIGRSYGTANFGTFNFCVMHLIVPYNSYFVRFC